MRTISNYIQCIAEVKREGYYKLYDRDLKEHLAITEQYQNGVIVKLTNLLDFQPDYALNLSISYLEKLLDNISLLNGIQEKIQSESYKGNDKQAYILHEFIDSYEDLISEILEQILSLDSNLVQREAYKKLVKEYLPHSSFNNYTIAEKQGKKNLYSYKWKFKFSLLKKLYNNLVSKKFIDENKTHYLIFKAVFDGKPIDEIKPIIWQSTNPAEPLYFIEKLQSHDDPKPIAEENHFSIQRFKACFFDKEGEPFNENLLNTRKKRTEKLSKELQKEIRETLKDI